MGGAVPVLRPPGQVRAPDGGSGAGALDGCGVGQPQVIAPRPRAARQCADGPGHGAGQGAQALVPARLAGQVGEHPPQVAVGVADPVPLAGVAQQGLHDRQGDDLGIRDPRGDPYRWPHGHHLGMGPQQVIDRDVQCGGEGLQIGVHQSCLHWLGNRVLSAPILRGPHPYHPAPTPHHTPWNQSSSEVLAP